MNKQSNDRQGQSRTYQTGYQQNPASGQRRPMTPEQKKAAAERARKRREALAKQEADRKKRQKAAEKKQKREAEQRRKAEERRRRHNERFELTEEEKAIRAQMKREEKEYHARQRVRRAKVLFGRFILFLGMFCVLLAVCFGLFYVNLVQYEVGARRNFTYKVGNNSSVSVSYDKMMRGGTLYLNMTPIIELCEMAVTGDTAELRYISRNAEEHVQFIVGSTQVFINGVEERLTAAPYLDGEDLYVPYDFFNSYVSGISVLYDTEKNSVIVAKETMPEDADTYMELRFVIRPDAPMEGLDEYNEFGKTSPVDFVADLDLYEEYMNPENRDDYLILVNSEYPLPQSYVPTTVEVSDIRYDGRPLQYMVFTAERAAHAMIMELISNGFEGVNILLGYRSYSKQRNLFDTTVEEYMATMTEEQAKVAAASVAQAAGCNPQQAGLSMVMHNLEDTSTAFAREPAYAWLEENCWKFGFIIRYPADKTAETGMAFQPYFFTYVGRYHAMRIMEQGISMEEYITQLEEKNYFGMPYADFRNQLLNKINQ